MRRWRPRGHGPVTPPGSIRWRWKRARGVHRRCASSRLYVLPHGGRPRAFFLPGQAAVREGGEGLPALIPAAPTGTAVSLDHKLPDLARGATRERVERLAARITHTARSRT